MSRVLLGLKVLILTTEAKRIYFYLHHSCLRFDEDFVIQGAKSQNEICSEDQGIEGMQELTEAFLEEPLFDKQSQKLLQDFNVVEHQESRAGFSFFSSLFFLVSLKLNKDYNGVLLF